MRTLADIGLTLEDVHRLMQPYQPTAPSISVEDALKAKMREAMKRSRARKRERNKARENT